MSHRKIQVLRESFAARAVYDTAVSRALLGQVAAGEVPESLRLYSPGKVLAFSLFDRRQAGFGAALEQARMRDFQPIVRLTGGRAAAFHRGTLGFGWCVPLEDARAGIRTRFDEISSIIQTMLARLGVDARVGKVDGEFCPGDHSVNARGTRKLMGVGQRVVRGAAYVGGVVLVSDAERVREVLGPVYRALECPFDPHTVGSISEEIGKVSVEEVASELQREFSRGYEMVDGSFDRDTLRLAYEFEPRHRADSPGASLSGSTALASATPAKVAEGSPVREELTSPGSGRR